MFLYECEGAAGLLAVLAFSFSLLSCHDLVCGQEIESKQSGLEKQIVDIKYTRCRTAEAFHFPQPLLDLACIDDIV